jgi:hypothetical protein
VVPAGFIVGGALGGAIGLRGAFTAAVLGQLLACAWRIARAPRSPGTSGVPTQRCPLYALQAAAYH